MLFWIYFLFELFLEWLQVVRFWDFVGHFVKIVVIKIVMHKSLAFERCGLSFNLSINLVIESFNLACFFSEKLWSIFFPVILNFVFSILLFKVRIKWFWIKASSDKSSATSTNEKLVLELLLFNILSWILRFYSISLKLILCKLNWIDFKKMLYFWRFLILYFESLFSSLVLREMFNDFINSMHSFSCY